MAVYGPTPGFKRRSLISGFSTGFFHFCIRSTPQRAKTAVRADIATKRKKAPRLQSERTLPRRGRKPHDCSQSGHCHEVEESPTIAARADIATKWKKAPRLQSQQTLPRRGRKPHDCSHSGHSMERKKAPRLQSEQTFYGEEESPTIAVRADILWRGKGGKIAVRADILWRGKGGKIAVRADILRRGKGGKIAV